MASDGESEEDLVTYGTALEPLEEDEPLKKPLPLHEQTVKDDRGRYQRFHGAFTGGFSAGYFNTVGSKEGWTPSNFVSSRQQKAEKHHARPEDFMDEEDFGEHGIAPATISRSAQFWCGRTDPSEEKKKAVSAQAAIIPGDTLLEELISPARLTVGVELLRKMGWKDGQGVGPRVKRRAGRARTATEVPVRVYGCSLPPAGSEESEDEDQFAPDSVTFAPKDVTPVDFSVRAGVQGLGYRGLDPSLALPGRGSAHLDLFTPHSDTHASLFGDAGVGRRRRGGVAGQAFGVGALEDEDDEEVYQRDSFSRYDTELGGEEPGDGLYGWTAPQQYGGRKDRSADRSYAGKILEGFTLAQNPAEEKTIFPPPVLPSNYRPVRRFRPVDAASLPNVSPALAEALRTSRGHMVTEDVQRGGRHLLDSGQRRALLGEDVLQGPTSVLDLLRPADRQRLLSLRNASTSHAPTGPTPAAHQPAGTLAVSSAPSVHHHHHLHQEAASAWRGASSCSVTFRPFEKNPDKQSRYDQYLNRLRQGLPDALEQSLDGGMTEWERSREREEFSRASILYRPSSSSLAARFTSAKRPDDQDAPLDGNQEVEATSSSSISDVSMADQSEGAAGRSVLIGQRSRETVEWHPDRLLCRRFNVPHPYPGSGIVGLLKVKRDKFSVFDFLTATDAPPPPLAPPPQAASSGKKSRWDVCEQKNDSVSERTDPGTAPPPAPPLDDAAPPPPAPPPAGSISEVKAAEQSRRDQEEEEEEEEESRPPMDLFKAIFEDSSDQKSSSSEGETEEEEEEAQQPTLFSITSSAPPPPPPAAPPPISATVKEEVREEFGPRLPPPAPPSAAPPARGGAGSRKEEQRSSSERRRKNKKQQKHKKEKKKKKHKKHKHKERSREEVQQEEVVEEEEEEVSTEELLRRLKNIRSHQSS